MTDREQADYDDAIGDAMQVTDRAFPLDMDAADHLDQTALRAACLTVVLADMLARTGA